MAQKILFIFLFIASFSAAEAQWVLNYQTLRQAIVKVSSSPNNSNFWFITNFDTLYKTSNGGVSWNIVAHPSFIPSGLFVLNKDTAFKTASAVIFRTTDGGEHWNVVFSDAGQEPPVVWMKNNSEGVFSFGGQLYKTTNGGDSWSTSLITQPPAPVTNSSGKGTIYSSGNNLWAALTNSKVAYSSNFGVSWSMAPNTGLPAAPMRIFFGSPGFGLAVVGNSPFIYVTTDGAVTWHIADNSSGANEDVAINNSHCWYIPNPGDHFYIKYSQDSGATWVEQLSGEGFNVLEKSRTGNTLWAGTITGKIYKYFDPVGIHNLQTGIPNSYSLSQNYPNPFNPSTRIKFDIPAGKTSKVMLSVFDILGREIANLVNEQLKPGTYEVEWDASNYPSGVYFYSLAAGDHAETRKMVLTK